MEKCGNWRAETLIWEAGTQKPSQVHNCIPTHCPMKSPTQHVPKPIQSFTVWSFLRHPPQGIHSHTLFLAGAHFPPTGTALNFACMCCAEVHKRQAEFYWQLVLQLYGQVICPGKEGLWLQLLLRQKG